MNIFNRPKRQIPVVKKNNCKIKVRRTKDGEQYSFENCKPEEIEAWKQIRQENKNSE